MLNMEMIFETHAHYDDEVFDEDRCELLSSLHDNGIGNVINVGSDMRSIGFIQDIIERYAFVYGASGIHPYHVYDLTDEDISRIRKLCDHEKTVAVGEIGLDYYRGKERKEEQIRWMNYFIELAREKKLPVIIHSREAAEDTINVMKSSGARDTGGVIHCYSYSAETAREFLDMGFFFGVGGVVTFKNARKLIEAVRYIPLEKILLETDSPYLSPEPNRGKRNSSLNLKYVARAVADIKGVGMEEVIRQTSQNACELFCLGDE